MDYFREIGIGRKARYFVTAVDYRVGMEENLCAGRARECDIRIDDRDPRRFIEDDAVERNSLSGCKRMSEDKYKDYKFFHYYPGCDRLLDTRSCA